MAMRVKSLFVIFFNNLCVFGASVAKNDPVLSYQTPAYMVFQLLSKFP